MLWRRSPELRSGNYNVLPPGAGTTNCGSGSGSSSSSFLFDMKLFYRLLKKFWKLLQFKSYYLLKKVFSRYLIKLSGPGAGTGARTANRICGSLEPEPKEIFPAPQHCLTEGLSGKWNSKCYCFFWL